MGQRDAAPGEAHGLCAQGPIAQWFLRGAVHSDEHEGLVIDPG